MRRFTATVRAFGIDEQYDGCVFDNGYVAVHVQKVSQLTIFPNIHAMKAGIGGRDVNASVRVTFIDDINA